MFIAAVFPSVYGAGGAYFSSETVLLSTVGFVKAADVREGMVIFGERGVSNITAVTHSNESRVTVCVVPPQFCGHPTSAPLLVTTELALRCKHWEYGVWAFCEPQWERKIIDSVVNIELESSFANTILLADGIVLEPRGVTNDRCSRVHRWLLRSSTPLRFTRIVQTITNCL